MRYVLDTNVLVDLLFERDEARHVACVELLRQIKLGKVRAVLLGVVVAETVWVLQSVYGVERKEVLRTIKPLTQMKGVGVVKKFNWNDIFEDFVKTKVKFVDAMIANIRQVKEKKWVVVSFDKDFDKLGVTRVEPGEILVE